MNYRTAKPEDKPEISALWQLCFPGDSEFCDYFTGHIFTGSDSFLACESGSIAAMAHVIRQPINFLGREIPAAYIFGIGTRPKCRGRGIAGGLIAHLLGELRAQGIMAAALVPQEKSLFGYYRRFDFAPVFSMAKTIINRADYPGSGDCTFYADSRSIPDGVIAGMDRVFSGNMILRSHLMRTAGHWRNVIDIAGLYGGGLIVCSREGETAGYSIFERQESGLLISELLADDEAAYNAAMAATFERFGADSAEYCTPACPKDAVDYGMVRILDAAGMLDLAAKQRKIAGNSDAEADYAFELRDEIIPGNSVRLTVSGGQLSVSEPQGSAYITPGQLAGILFSSGPLPYANLLFS